MINQSISFSFVVLTVGQGSRPAAEGDNQPQFQASALLPSARRMARLQTMSPEERIGGDRLSVLTLNKLAMIMTIYIDPVI
jgi:hypothetical protein